MAPRRGIFQELLVVSDGFLDGASRSTSTNLDHLLVSCGAARRTFDLGLFAGAHEAFIMRCTASLFPLRGWPLKKHGISETRNHVTGGREKRNMSKIPRKHPNGGSSNREDPQVLTMENNTKIY